MDIRLINNVFFFCLFGGLFVLGLFFFSFRIGWVGLLFFFFFLRCVPLLQMLTEMNKGFLWFRASKPGCTPSSRNFTEIQTESSITVTLVQV